MLDIGWTEFAVIALIALIVVGPKDLPGALRAMGRWMRKARSLSREFQSSMDEMLREAELDEAKKAIEATRSGKLSKTIEDAVDPGGEMRKGVGELDRDVKADRAGDTTRSTVKSASSGSAPKGKAEADTGSAPDEPKRAGYVKHEARIAPSNSIRPPNTESGTATGADTAREGGGAGDGSRAQPQGTVSNSGKGRGSKQPEGAGASADAGKSDV